MKANSKQIKITSQSKTILYIEDERALTFVMCNKLKHHGYEVDLAHDGDEGLKKIIKNKPDLVLLDLILPIKNGWEILTEMRKKKLLQKIPVIVMTNLGQDSDIQKSLKMGAVDYIIKSDFSINDVLEKVKKYIK